MMNMLIFIYEYELTIHMLTYEYIILKPTFFETEIKTLTNMNNKKKNKIWAFNAHILFTY